MSPKRSEGGSGDQRRLETVPDVSSPQTDSSEKRGVAEVIEEEVEKKDPLKKPYRKLTKFFRNALGTLDFPDFRQLNDDQKNAWMAQLTKLQKQHKEDSRSNNDKKEEFRAQIQRLKDMRDITQTQVEQKSPDEPETKNPQHPQETITGQKKEEPTAPSIVSVHTEPPTQEAHAQEAPMPDATRGPTSPTIMTWKCYLGICELTKSNAKLAVAVASRNVATIKEQLKCSETEANAFIREDYKFWENYNKAGKYAIEARTISQRALTAIDIPQEVAKEIIKMMEERGIVSKPTPGKSRTFLSETWPPKAPEILRSQSPTATEPDVETRVTTDDHERPTLDERKQGLRTQLISHPLVTEHGFTVDQLMGIPDKLLKIEVFNKILRAVDNAKQLGREETCKLLDLDPTKYNQGDLPKLIRELYQNAKSLQEAASRLHREDDREGERREDVHVLVGEIVEPAPSEATTEPSEAATPTPSEATTEPSEAATPTPSEDAPVPSKTTAPESTEIGIPAPSEAAAEPQEAAPTTPSEIAPPPEKPTPISASRRSMFGRFISRLKGEAQPEEESDYRKTAGDYYQKGALALTGGFASVIGYKGFYDVPAWGIQKITTWFEKRRIYKEIQKREAQLELSKDSNLLDKKKQMFEEQIRRSKFLTKAKKAELVAELQKNVDDYNKKDAALRKNYNEKIDQLLKKYINTRVKTSTAVKEGVNTVLMLSTLMAARAGWFGLVSLVQRDKKIRAEMVSGERKGGYINEMFVKGFTETITKLAGGVPAFAKTGLYGSGALIEWTRQKWSKQRSGKLAGYVEKLKTEAPKTLRAMEGAATVMRVAGLGGMAIAEFFEAGNMEGMFDAALDAWEKKGVLGTAMENLREAPTKPFEAAGALYRRLTDEEIASAEIPTASSPPASSPPAATGATIAHAELGESDVSSDIPVATVQTEIPTDEVQTVGLVHKDDGIVKILERHRVSHDQALEAARDAGIVRATGDTRLTTKAIDRLSVFAEPQSDGGIEIKFFDNQTNTSLTLNDARAAGFTYESGTAPGEIATDREIVEHVPEPTHGVEVLADSPAPNDLLNGTFHIYVDENGHYSGVETGDGNQRERMTAALEELERLGHADSPEAQFITRQRDLLPENEFVEEHEAPSQVATSSEVSSIQTDEVQPEPLIDDEPLHRFRGDSGRVRFDYNPDGTVKDAWMPSYTPHRRDIEDALHEWGLTRKAVEEHFFGEGRRYTTTDGQWIDRSHPNRFPTVDRPGAVDMSPEAQYRGFVRDTERLARQEALLEEMETEGLKRTPEYAHLEKETKQLQGLVTREMTREFNIKEREI